MEATTSETGLVTVLCMRCGGEETVTQELQAEVLRMNAYLRGRDKPEVDEARTKMCVDCRRSLEEGKARHQQRELDYDRYWIQRFSVSEISKDDIPATVRFYRWADIYEIERAKAAAAATAAARAGREPGEDDDV